jgi:endonuclease/exonuclease/phosphatase family metal-dependent hydrolase
MFVLPALVILTFCWKFLFATVNFSSWSGETGENTFSVMSYNVSQFARPSNYFFDRYWKGDRVLKNSKAMIEFVAKNKADIKCIQEFYSDSNSVVYNSKEKILDHRMSYFVESTKELHINKARFGVAIFSKFPIINTGELIYSNNVYNRGIFADVQVGNDTVRIVNVHLQSTQMGIAFTRPFFSKWKSDQKARARQADLLVDFVSKSPHPIILTGDLNATPFGYVYSRIHGSLSNSFERKGKGIGYTFSGKIIKFLHIDHQFFGRGIEVKSFITHHAISYSDHYPIEGKYELPD